MAAARKLKIPAAWVFGLPLTLAEAHAFQAWESGVYTEEQRETLMAWKVAMTLAHGTWVHEQLGALGT
jgi:hypothetical protein